MFALTAALTEVALLCMSAEDGCGIGPLAATFCCWSDSWSRQHRLAALFNVCHDINMPLSVTRALTIWHKSISLTSVRTNKHYTITVWTSKTLADRHQGRCFTPQPDTSLHCQTTDTGLVHRAVCLLCPRFRWYSLRLPTEGWPGWVDLAGWLHTKMVYTPADGHPSKY